VVLALLANIRLVRIFWLEANTLAYFLPLTVKNKASYRNSASVANVFKAFLRGLVKVGLML
jgi:hypothetical protein